MLGKGSCLETSVWLDARGAARLLRASTHSQDNFHARITPATPAVLSPQGTLVATRVREGQEPRTASVLPGSLVSCAAFLSSTRTKCEFAAGGEPCLLAGFGARELNSLLYDDSGGRGSGLVEGTGDRLLHCTHRV